MAKLMKCVFCAVELGPIYRPREGRGQFPKCYEESFDWNLKFVINSLKDILKLSQNKTHLYWHNDPVGSERNTIQNGFKFHD